MKTKTLIAAALVGVFGATAAHAQLSWSKVYGTLGVSYVDLRREAPANPLITRDSKNDIGLSFGIGYQVHPKVGLEIGRYDLGTARLTDAGPGGPNYADQSATAVVTAVKVTPWTDWTFAPFAKLGVANTTITETSSNGTPLRESRNRSYAAVGVDYRVMDKVKIGLSYEQFWPHTDEAAPAGRPPRLKPRALTLSTTVSF
jgi:opacity protein-like surface antigen